MKPLKSIECLTLDTPSFAQGNRVDERVRARCRYCCSVSPTTIPIAPTGVPDGSRVCSSSHGSLGCFHIIQPIRWAGFGSLIINVDSIQSIFRHFSYVDYSTLHLQQGDHAGASGWLRRYLIGSKES